MAGLEKSMDKYEYEGFYECYESLCVSTGFYGCLRESMDKYMFVSVCEGLWKFAHVYGRFRESIGVYGNLRIGMSMWMSIGNYEIPWVVGKYGYLCMSMRIGEFVRVYGSLWGAMDMGPKHPL